MKTIMLCLNKLDTGGVQTAVYNQMIQLIKRNYKVIILAEDGIYREKFEEEGAIFINFKFEVKNKYDFEKINKITQIINEYNVEQVHIHQFDCVNVTFPACIFSNVPYIAYAHTGILGIYDWFENSYPGYNFIFKLYFECAEKIIAITEQAKQENINKYNIDSDKYIIINNSIDFEKIVVENCIPNKIENILIISRFSKEKMLSIENAILIFKNYLETNKNAKLTIVGDGECRKEVENQIETIREYVEMLGERNDIMEIIAKNDLIIAVDRCILESISMKKISIISGYDGIKGIVTPEIVEKAASMNFSGKNFENQDVKKVVNDINKLNEIEIKNIVEKNYEYAYEKLNASKNIYVIENVDEQYVQEKYKEAMKLIIELQNLYTDRINKEEEDWKEWEKSRKWFEEQIKYRDGEIIKIREEKNELMKELEQIYNSRTWKFSSKIQKIIKKK